MRTLRLQMSLPGSRLLLVGVKAQRGSVQLEISVSCVIHPISKRKWQMKILNLMKVHQVINFKRTQNHNWDQSSVKASRRHP